MSAQLIRHDNKPHDPKTPNRVSVLYTDYLHFSTTMSPILPDFVEEYIAHAVQRLQIANAKEHPISRMHRDFDSNLSDILLQARDEIKTRVNSSEWIECVRRLILDCMATDHSHATAMKYLCLLDVLGTDTDTDFDYENSHLFLHLPKAFYVCAAEGFINPANLSTIARKIHERSNITYDASRPLIEQDDYGNLSTLRELLEFFEKAPPQPAIPIIPQQHRQHIEHYIAHYKNLEEAATSKNFWHNARNGSDERLHGVLVSARDEIKSDMSSDAWHAILYEILRETFPHFNVLTRLGGRPGGRMNLSSPGVFEGGKQVFEFCAEEGLIDSKIATDNLNKLGIIYGSLENPHSGHNDAHDAYGFAGAALSKICDKIPPANQC